jgi:hypothetical protein
MSRNHSLKLQQEILQVLKYAQRREQAINELVEKRGLSYEAMRKLRNLA